MNLDALNKAYAACFAAKQNYNKARKAENKAAQQEALVTLSHIQKSIESHGSRAF